MTDPRHAPTSLRDRIMRRVRIDGDGCWLWTGAVRSEGYGTLTVGSRTDGTRRTRDVHRAMYEEVRGAVPPGLHLDHLCRNRTCANPEHLEPVTCRENLLRGETYAAQNAAKSHCPRGHEYAGENLLVVSNQGRRPRRVCRACQTARSRRRAEAAS